MEKKTILVVDDDKLWLDRIERILAGQYDVKRAENRSEAMALAQSCFFSLAILDQKLPGGVSGMDIFNELSALQPGLRTIILTGFAGIDDAVQSIRLGAFDYISKDNQDLLTVLPLRVENALTDNLHQATLSKLIANGESSHLEFKSSARWDMRQAKVSREVESAVVKTVAAFLNSQAGGILLIGVDDSGEIVGLQNDYNTLKRQDYDGFENFLVTLLLNAYGKEVSPFIQVDFFHHEGKDVCRVCAKPAHKPVFVADGTAGEHFFIRTGNSTRQLSTREAIEYCKLRWQ